MTDKLKNTALIVVPIAALALGGAAIAGAASSDGSKTARVAKNARSGTPPRRADERALSGDTASKVRALALDRVPGGAIERLETDADGNAAYEAHMRKADGSRVAVYVNSSFEVVAVQSGP
jgi:uncharacterized membrane protein YkoI